METQHSRVRFFLGMMLFTMISISLYASPHPEQIDGHSASYQKKKNLIRMESETLTVDLNPATLETTLIRKDHPNDKVFISQAVFRKKKFSANLNDQSIIYPQDGFRITFNLDKQVLKVTFHSLRPQTIKWPSVLMKKESTSLIWPHFEGNYIPLNDTIWTEFLKSREWNTTEAQYMPFWGVERGNQLLSYLIENPFHNTIAFAEKGSALQMFFTHTFPNNSDLSKPITFSMYLDYDASPITPAKYFRHYLKDHDAFVTLEDKMKTAPLISRLIGAPHAYIWDGAPITIADVKTNGWIPLAKAIVDQTTSPNPTAGKQIMRALSPEKGNFEAMSRQSAPPQHLQQAMVNSFSHVLSSSGLYNESVWPLSALPAQYKRIAERILDGENVLQYELVQLNSYLLHSSFPECLNSPSTWGNGVSTRMIDALAHNGMDRFVLTCNGIENIDIRPNIASYAAEKGYLIGPYDSYFEIQDPDAPEWPTAIFDRALYKTGGIIQANGTPVKGFLGVGYYVSPIAIKPYFDERVSENFQKAPHSYYFLDCDAFGEFFDDYHSGRIISASEDVAARVDRVRSIFEKYKVPVGSEGGSYLFAGSLAVAEGVFFPTITGDPDMESKELSKYFVGRPFPADEPERFFLPVLLKDKYVRLLSDPRFRLPLYEAVFHDSVITTSHYASSSLKFKNIAETGALTEILYQVAPMYHFNLSHFEKIKAAIEPHIDIFKKTHSYSYRYALEEFDYLTDDRNVQKTRFGDLELIANFQEKDFVLEGTNIPARSLLITFMDSGESLVYHNSAFASSKIEAPAKVSISSLIRELKDEEWEVRKAAATALANMEAAAVPAIPALTEALTDEEWQVRRPAAYALAALGKKGKKAVPNLIAALNDDEWQVRKPAALALGSIGAAARAAVPALKAKLGDPELQVRMAVELALKKIK